MSEKASHFNEREPAVTLIRLRRRRVWRGGPSSTQADGLGRALRLHD